MAHHRKIIRDAVAAVLTTADTAAGDKVYTSRSRPVPEQTLKQSPVLSVYTADETSRKTADSHALERVLMVSIEGLAAGGDDLDDTLDNLAEQVEAAINANPNPDNLLTESLALTGTTSEISSRGNLQVGAFRMDFECTYMTPIIDEGDPGTRPDTVYTLPMPNADRYEEIFKPEHQQPEECGVCDDEAWGGDLTDEHLVRP